MRSEIDLNLLAVNAAASLAEYLAPVVYETGSVIFQEGDVAVHAYLIERGTVEVSKEVGGASLVFAEIGAGELLGEIAAIDGDLRTATATATEEVELIPNSRDLLSALVADADPLLSHLLHVLLNRLRNTQDCVVSGGGVVRSSPLLPRREFGVAYQEAKERALERIRLERALRAAVNQRELDLFFQPIVRLSDRRIAGFEALIRWFSPERGFVPPDQFIGVAEQTGAIIPIGLWVLEHACHQLGRLQTQLRGRSGASLSVAVNVSARQLYDQVNVDQMKSVIVDSGVDPRDLKLEITERVLVDSPEAATKAFRQLKDLGVKLAIDDFGTGYSGLSYLHRFPLDTLKIDRSFVSTMIKDKGVESIVNAVSRLAVDLRMDVVAEGVEEEVELTRLEQFGVEYAQGYYFSKPVPFEEASALLRPAAAEEVDQQFHFLRSG